MTNTKLHVGEMPRQTRRTTLKNYDADLEIAYACFDERTEFRNRHDDPEISERMHKTIMDALNNEWKRDITIERWVELAIEATSLRPRRR